MELYEKQISREIIFEGKVFTACKDVNELPDGRLAPRELVIHSGGSGILPVDKEGNVTLVKQYRCGAGKVCIEMCAGKREIDEDPKECAVRELKEELGFVADNVLSLGTLIPTPAYDTEVIYIYLATGLKNVGSQLDDGEFLETVTMPLGDAIKLVMSGEIDDAKTQIALLKAERLLNGKN